MAPADGWRNGIDWLPNGRSKGYPPSARVSVSCCNGGHGNPLRNPEFLDLRRHTMRLSWPEHLQTARTLELSGDDQRGTALALMGVALLLLAQDLLSHELEQPPAGND
ncbi:MAG: hypothetical protein WBN89_02565 [Prochlorococcaceae cyanobacterium]